MPLLQVKGLVKFYGRRAVVNGVDFEVNTGEVVGLLGPNGAGKTTSFRMATGQITPNVGTVWFNGSEVTQLPMYQRARIGMGYLPQETSVFRKLTVEQNILAILELMPKSRSLGRSLTRKERHERMEAAVHRFGLGKVRKNVAARLSGGEKRRLEIARCLVCEPLLILADEPFTGIDPITIAEIRQIILELRNEGIGILLTDHNVHEALKITSRSYLLKDGKVRTHGSPAQIVRDPVAIAEYLGAGFTDASYRDPNMPSPEPHAVTANVPNLSLAKAKPEPIAPPEPTSTLEFASPQAKPGPQPKPGLSPAQVILEQERILLLIDKLKGPEFTQTAEALVQKGPVAVSALLNTLERKDAELRQRSVDVLQRILNRPVAFDAFAPEATRRQQLSALRDVHERKAG